jgi:hypothetical protein
MRDLELSKSTADSRNGENLSNLSDRREISPSLVHFICVKCP